MNDIQVFHTYEPEISHLQLDALIQCIVHNAQGNKVILSFHGNSVPYPSKTLNLRLMMNPSDNGDASHFQYRHAFSSAIMMEDTLRAGLNRHEIHVPKEMVSILNMWAARWMGLVLSFDCNNFIEQEPREAADAELQVGQNQTAPAYLGTPFATLKEPEAANTLPTQLAARVAQSQLELGELLGFLVCPW